MNGLLKIIDMLGNTILQLEQKIVDLQKQLEAATKPADPIPSGDQKTASSSSSPSPP